MVPSRKKGKKERPSEKKRLANAKNASRARGAPSHLLPASDKALLNETKSLIRLAICGPGRDRLIRMIKNRRTPFDAFKWALEFGANRCGLPVQSEVEVSGSDIPLTLVLVSGRPKPGAEPVGGEA